MIGIAQQLVSIEIGTLEMKRGMAIGGRSIGLISSPLS